MYLVKMIAYHVVLHSFQNGKQFSTTQVVHAPRRPRTQEDMDGLLRQCCASTKLDPGTSLIGGIFEIDSWEAELKEVAELVDQQRQAGQDAQPGPPGSPLMDEPIEGPTQ